MAEREKQDRKRSGEEEPGETGMHEGYRINNKRTVDDHLEQAQRASAEAQRAVEQMAADERENARQLNAISRQHLQNAVKIADTLASNNAVIIHSQNNSRMKHEDLAEDRKWNQDEVSSLTAKTGAQQDLVQAIAAISTGLAALQAAVASMPGGAALKK